MHDSSRLHFSVLLSLTALLLAGVTFPAPAQDRSAPPQGIDPKADEVLRKMSRTLADAKQFTFEAHDMIDHVIDNGQKVQFSKNLKLAVRRPGQVAAEVEGDQQHLRYSFHDGKLLLVNLRDNCYAMHDVPKTIDVMFDHMAETYGITPPLADLMFADPYKAMTERVRVGRYLGVNQVKGVKCHHLAFRQEGVDWQIWIEDSEQALPRKVVITYKEMPGYPQFVAFLDNWDLNPQIPDSTFSLKPPDGCKRVDLVPVGTADQKTQDNR